MYLTQQRLRDYLETQTNATSRSPTAVSSTQPDSIQIAVGNAHLPIPENHKDSKPSHVAIETCVAADIDLSAQPDHDCGLSTEIRSSERQVASGVIVLMLIISSHSNVLTAEDIVTEPHVTGEEANIVSPWSPRSLPLTEARTMSAVTADLVGTVQTYSDLKVLRHDLSPLPRTESLLPKSLDVFEDLSAFIKRSYPGIALESEIQHSLNEHDLPWQTIDFGFPNEGIQCTDMPESFHMISMLPETPLICCAPPPTVDSGSSFPLARSESSPQGTKRVLKHCTDALGVKKADNRFRQSQQQNTKRIKHRCKRRIQFTALSQTVFSEVRRKLTSVSSCAETASFPFLADADTRPACIAHWRSADISLPSIRAMAIVFARLDRYMRPLEGLNDTVAMAPMVSKSFHDSVCMSGYFVAQMRWPGRRLHNKCFELYKHDLRSYNRSREQEFQRKIQILHTHWISDFLLLKNIDCPSTYMFWSNVHSMVACQDHETQFHVIMRFEGIPPDSA